MQYIVRDQLAARSSMLLILVLQKVHINSITPESPHVAYFIHNQVNEQIYVQLVSKSLEIALILF